jgi:cell division protein FtsL
MNQEDKERIRELQSKLDDLNSQIAEKKKLKSFQNSDHSNYIYQRLEGIGNYFKQQAYENYKLKSIDSPSLLARMECLDTILQDLKYDVNKDIESIQSTIDSTMQEMAEIVDLANTPTEQTLDNSGGMV